MLAVAVAAVVEELLCIVASVASSVAEDIQSLFWLLYSWVWLGCGFCNGAS